MPPHCPNGFVGHGSAGGASALGFASGAFASLSSEPGCAVTLAAPQTLPSLLQAVLAALQAPTLGRSAAASQSLLSGLMRLVVSVSSHEMHAALHTVVSPILLQLEPLSRQLNAEVSKFGRAICWPLGHEHGMAWLY